MSNEKSEYKDVPGTRLEILQGEYYKLQNELALAKEENERLIQKYDFQFIVKEREKLKEANQVLRDAVEFYGDRKNWDEVWIDGDDEDSGGDCSCQMIDDVEIKKNDAGSIYYSYAGKKAREALASADKIMGDEK